MLNFFPFSAPSAAAPHRIRHIRKGGRAVKSAADSLETETFTAEREWVVEGIPVLTARIALPEPVGPETRLKRRIRRYYRTQCRAYLRYCGRQLFPMAAAAYRAALASSAPLPCFHAELTYHVTCHEGGFWSLYTQSQEPTTAAGRCCAAGATPGICVPAIRRRCRPSFLLTAAGKNSCCIWQPGRSGSRKPQGTPVSARLAAEAPPEFQRPEFLSDTGGAGFLLPHVRHCPGYGGHPRVYRSVEPPAG